MKRKLLFLAFILISAFANAQYPLLQYLGSDSTIVKSRGGLQGRFAPIPFTDTTSANLSRISQYPGALIYTSGVDKYWYRNATTTGWIEFTSSGGSTVNIYNSNGTLTGERTVDGDGNGLSFNSFRWFAVGADSIQLSLNSDVFRIFGIPETQDTSTYKPLVLDPITGRVLQSSYWYGSGGSGVNIYNSNGTLTSDRNLDGTGFSLGFQTLSKFWTQSDTVDIELLSTGAKVFNIHNLTETQDTTTYKPMVVDPVTGRVLQSSYWYGGTGGSSSGIVSLGTSAYGLITQNDSTYKVDTTLLSTKLWRQKGIDSVQGNVNLKLNISDTAAMLSGYTRVQRFLDSLSAHTTRFDGVTSSLATKLNISDTVNMRPRLYAGSNVTITGTYPNLTIASTGGSAGDTSAFIIDTLYNRIGHVINADSLRFKSLRVQLNGSTVSPTVTDSTLSWNIIASGGTTGVKSVEIVGDSAYLVNDSSTFVNANKVYGYQSGTKGWKDTKKMTFTIPTTGEVVMLSGDSLINGRKVDTAFISSSGDSLVTRIAGTRYAYKITSTGGATPAGNYGNVQLNRNSALASPASDSLNFTAGTGLSVKGKYLIGGTQVAYLPPSMTGTSVFGDGGNSLSHSTANQGYYNTLVGITSGGTMTTGYMNTAVGWSSMGGATVTGWENTGVGTGALYSLTNGQQNVAIGKYASFSTTTALNTIGIGFESLYTNNGSYNIGLGHSAGRLNSSGTENLYIGYFAGYYNQTGSFNTYLGSQAGLGTTLQSNANNVGIGYKNLYAITTGSNNISIGFQAGDALTSGTKNIIIGYDIDAASNTGSNQMTIGNAIFGTGLTGTGTTAAGKVGILNNAPDSTFDVTGGMKTSGGVRFTGLPNGGTSSDSLLVATSAGQVKKINTSNFAIQTENQYTPSLTNTTNIAASTAYATFYTVIGSTVHVWGTVDIDATSALSVCEMGLSLPVASSLANIYNLAGTASFEDNTVVQIKADVANARAMWRFTPQTATNNKYSFHFTYKYTAP